MNFKAEQKLLELHRQRKKRCTDRASMQLLFEASLTQPNSANLLGKKSEQQRGYRSQLHVKKHGALSLRNQTRSKATANQMTSPNKKELPFAFRIFARRVLFLGPFSQFPSTRCFLTSRRLFFWVFPRPALF